MRRTHQALTMALRLCVPPRHRIRWRFRPETFLCPGCGCTEWECDGACTLLPATNHNTR